MIRPSVALVCLALAGCSSEDDSSSGPSSDAGSGGAAGTGGGASCQTDSAAGIRSCVEKSALASDIAFVAQPREPGSAHWQQVQSLCQERFEQAGFAVTLQDYGTGVNVVGVRQGTDKAAERVLVSAHYDHIPGCAGADDNGTGVVSVLETARVLKDVTFGRTLVLACWDEEESGLIGAEAYALAAKQSGENIVVMVSLEMLGFKTTQPNTQQVPVGIDILFPVQYAELEASIFVGDFLTLVPDTSAAASADRVAAHAAEIGLRTVTLEITDSLKKNPIAGDVRRSDHAAFWDQDIPAMMLTDTSEFRNPNYHCQNGEDTVETLDLDFLTDNTRAMAGATVDLLELRPAP